MKNVALTIIGDDRPGLVSELSQVVTDHQGNWLESRLTRLAGKFAGVALVCVPATEFAAFETAVTGLAGLNVTTSLTDAGSAGGVELRVSLVGNDRPGIVAQVTSALAGLGISIEEFSSEVGEAPMAGGQLFSAQAVIRLPDGVDEAAVLAALEPLAGELMVDFEVDAEPALG